MGTHQRKRALLSLSVLLAGFAALVFAAPGLWGVTPDAKGDKARLAAGKQEKAHQVRAEALAKSLTRDDGCCCGGSGECGCCSARGGKSCCSKTHVVQAAPLGQLLARAGDEKAEGQKKDKMKMASKEAMAKGVAARKAIAEHQKALTGDGVYSCCIKPGCTFCSTAADMCPCAMNLAKGMPVCPECWGGWQVGMGNLPGVDASKVQVIPKGKLKMMYGMKAKNFEKAAEKK